MPIHRPRYMHEFQVRFNGEKDHDMIQEVDNDKDYQQDTRKVMCPF